MNDFRCVPIPTETAERFRRTGTDDAGNTLRQVVAAGNGSPCRHCLRLGQAGEVMLLGSYNLPGPLGIYWTPSPIFVHAEPCEAFSAMNALPEIVRYCQVSVRSYDQDDQCIYDLGEAIDGISVEAPLARAIADPRTKFVNIHTAKPGCMLCRVERI